jgi:cation transport ATPase
VETRTQEALVYFVSGMWCTSCARGLRDSVGHVDGVLGADVNYASKLMRVEIMGGRAVDEVDALIRARVDRSGFGIKRQPAGWTLGFRDELAQELDDRPGWPLVATVWFLAMWCSMLAFAGYSGGLPERDAFLLSVLSSVLGLPAILLGVIPYAVSGLRALSFGRRLTLDLFVFLGGSSAVVVSLVSLLHGRAVTYADSGSMVVALLLLSKKIENSVLKRVSSSLLFELDPKRGKMEVWRNQAWRPAEASQLRRGDRIRVAAGETIAVDGELSTPIAKVNGHLLSGESAALTLAEGDHLFAGMIALSGLEMRVRAPMGERKIDAWAEAALTGGPRGSRYTALASRIESALATAALTGACLLAAHAGYRTGRPGAAAEAFFIGVLVFCPCLFASIIPLARQLAHLALLRAGVAVHRAEALLDLARVRHFYFDKTGTLEEIGSRFEPLPGAPDLEPYLRELALRSLHPVLRGLEGGGKRRPLHGLREIPGLGLSARAETGDQLVVGRPAFLQQCGVVMDRELDRDFPCVAFGGKLAGKIVVKRFYDAKARRLLARLLRAFPAADAEILSGDPAPGAGERFRELGARITYHGNLSPEAKAARIRPHGAFVGDGLNDTLAMAKADVSFRVGHRAAAFVPADFHLPASNVELVLVAARYARKCRRVLAQTAFAAFAYNLVAFGLAAQGRFTPLGAVLAMMGSFVALLLSSSRLLRIPGGQR